MINKNNIIKLKGILISMKRLVIYLLLILLLILGVVFAKEINVKTLRTSNIYKRVVP